MLRHINPRLSLHYWDWTQDPRRIPNANLGEGRTGELNLFTPDFMGYGGPTDQSIDEPWLGGGYYRPPNPNDPNDSRIPRREDTGNPADSPRNTFRHVSGSPASSTDDDRILNAPGFAEMNNAMIPVHDRMHNFVAMGPVHRSFEDPFVFLLHSNVDRLFARWQTDPAHQERLDPNTVYGSESPFLNVQVEPWSTGRSFDEHGLEHFTRPWYAPEKEGSPHTYTDYSIVNPPLYDTNHPSIFESILQIYYLIEPGVKEPDPVIYLKTIKDIDKPLSQDKNKALQQLADIRKQLTDQFKNGKRKKSAFDTLDKAISKLIDRESKKL